MTASWKVNPGTVKVLAEKELLDAVRNRWFHIFAALFFLVSFLIAYLGFLRGSGTGFESFNRTTASLLNFILFLVPMITLLLGGTSIAGEREQGSLALLLSKPVSAAEVVLGKYLGTSVAVILAIFTGFGLMGLIIAFKVSVADARAFFAFIFLSILLALSFLSIAILLSAWMEKRLSAVISAVLVWFFTILLYDFIVMWLAGLLKGKAMAYFLLFAILGNPADSVRVLSIINLGGETVFGPSLATLAKMLGSASSTAILYSGILLWIVVPLVAAIYLFQKRGQA